MLFSSVGFTCTRTAGRELPQTSTCPTPSICESFCASTESAKSYICGRPTRSELSANIRIGASAGFAFQ